MFNRYGIAVAAGCAAMLVGAAPAVADSVPAPMTRSVGEAPSQLSPFANAPSGTETVSQRNARTMAAEYLAISAFSRQGLIEQLEFEGFSTADATYGADGVNADWYEQAAQAARDYLDFSSFSRSGLIDQLVFEGFTADQAEFGVSAAGL